ncbi:hypothetical protein V1524DRAFT_450205 [Lipomyces starkeyi]
MAGENLKPVLIELGGKNAFLLDADPDIAVLWLTCDLTRSRSGNQLGIVCCIGLNYLKHIIEAGRTPPPYPSLFLKPSSAVDDYGARTPIPKVAQDQQSDYEGTYVAGYTIGDDMSARKWQRNPELAGSGPCIVSKDILGDGSGVILQTRVNGELRQDSNTDDFLFGVAKLIAFLSQGTTLEKGSIIMTGTPGGVGFALGKYLQDGDVVEIYIEKVGILRHSIVYE